MKEVSPKIWYGKMMWKNKNWVINYTISSDVTSGLSKEEVIKTTNEEFYKAMLNGLISKDHPVFSSSEIMCATQIYFWCDRNGRYKWLLGLVYI